MLMTIPAFVMSNGYTFSSWDEPLYFSTERNRLIPVSSRSLCRRISPRARNASGGTSPSSGRSEEHTSELQSQFHLVCRLLLEKKNSIANSDVRFNVRTIDGKLVVASINNKPLTDPEWTNRFQFNITDDGSGTIKFAKEELVET